MSKLNDLLRVPDTGRKAHVGPLSAIDSDLGNSIPELNLNIVPEYELDFMILCADNTDDLKSKCRGLRYAKYDSMLWVALPKKQGVSEDEVFNDECRQMMSDNNVTVVNQVDLNEDWQAFQFRPFERVS